MPLGSILLLLAVVILAALPFCAIGLGLLLGLAQPIRAAAIQRLAGDAIRAGAASTASACDMAITTITLPLAGLWRGRRR